MVNAMPPLIALVGSDGSGKSTVGEHLVEWMRTRRPAELCHLGKQSDNMARLVAGLPFVGKRAVGSIQANLKDAEGGKAAGFFTSIGIYAFTVRRLHRFRRMLKLRQDGYAILADRFPQDSIRSGIDGPGFGRVNAEHGLAHVLDQRERRDFAWMLSHPPDLVIKLKVDLATAIARKPDHVPARLEAKIAEIARVDFHAPTVVIDANRPLDEVLAAAKAAIEPLLAR
jgi:thymidylate kinase